MRTNEQIQTQVLIDLGIYEAALNLSKPLCSTMIQYIQIQNKFLDK